MKRYITVTGVVFALIVVAHVLRVVAEGPQLLMEADWVLLTIAAAGLAVWAWRLVRGKPGA